MSSKKAMKQAQKQAYAKHRSSITNSRFNIKNKNMKEYEMTAPKLSVLEKIKLVE